MLTEQQKEARLGGIGGSDSGIICQVNGYKTPFELWMEKTRRLVPKDIADNPRVKAGNMLEEAVLKWCEDETGKEVIQGNEQVYHKDYEWMFANVDGIVKGESAIVEAKTASNPSEWGESGSNKIPPSYLCQVAHYCIVTNSDRAYVAVLINGFDFRWYTYERDAALEKMILEKEKLFYYNYLKPDIAPPPITTKDVLLHLNGRVNQETACANADIDASIDYLLQLKRKIKEMEATEEEIKDKLCAFMGENQALVGLDGKPAATWRLSKAGKRFDKKASEALKEKYPLVYNELVSTTEGSRRFLLRREEKL